jgi:hypothetical protein
MKAIFSFWSKCSNESSDRRMAGFYNEHFFITSFKLAIACAKRSFKTIEIYTDKVGYELLILKHKLTVDAVHTVLDDINHYPSDLWMTGKLYTYSLQKEPFIHLDYDLYLLKPIPSHYFNESIIVQCEELFEHTDVYEWGIDWVRSTNQNLPKEFNFNTEIPYKYQKANNLGLVGGQAFDAIADFGKRSLQMIEENATLISQLPVNKQNQLNIIYEQFFFTQYMLYHNIKVKAFMPDALKRYRFDNDTFVHMLSKVKSYYPACVEMEEAYFRFLKAQHNNVS